MELAGQLGGVGWTHGALNIAMELKPTFLGSHHHFTRALDLLSFDRRVYYLFLRREDRV